MVDDHVSIRADWSRSYKAMLRRNRSIALRVSLGLLALLVVGSLFLIPKLNARLTSYIESDAFRVEMGKETAKGLHFATGRYQPIKRTSTWTTETAGFQAKDGQKALRAIDARGVTAKFNPWGVFKRVWYLEDVRISGGEAQIQAYEPRPEPSPPKPWYAKYIFPERVYLNRVESEPVDVTWHFREKRAGIFGARLLITPHDRDFEYQAQSGQLKMTPFPDLQVKHIHMLITKQLLTLYNMDLTQNGTAGASVHLEGKAGTAPNDRAVDFRYVMDRVPIQEWVPADWRAHVDGFASSRIHWTGKDTKLENSGGEANCWIDRGEIHGLPFLQKIAALTNDRSLEHPKLDICRFDAKWLYPRFEVRRIAIEQKEKFRAEGEVSASNESLRGIIELGIKPSLLGFLTAPVIQEVFPREDDGYRWTTVHLSGTIDEPHVDLSDRLLETIKEHPAAMLKIFLRQISGSLRSGSETD